MQVGRETHRSVIRQPPFSQQVSIRIFSPSGHSNQRHGIGYFSSALAITASALAVAAAAFSTAMRSLSSNSPCALWTDTENFSAARRSAWQFAARAMNAALSSIRGVVVRPSSLMISQTVLLDLHRNSMLFRWRLKARHGSFE